MKTKTIREEVNFKASPEKVYDLLMDSKKHSEFTGGKASISQEVGGEFSAYDGYAYGINQELIPGRKIVQTWRASDWPEEHYSTVTFEFEEMKGGTKLTFVQDDVPEEQYEAIKQGWTEYYWEPMKEMLAKQ